LGECDASLYRCPNHFLFLKEEASVNTHFTHLPSQEQAAFQNLFGTVVPGFQI
jgi:hypothetical protein